MPSQGSYTPTRQLEDDGPYVMPGDSAYVAELHNSVQQLQGAHALLLGGAAPRLWGAIAVGAVPQHTSPNSAHARPRPRLAHGHATL